MLDLLTVLLLSLIALVTQQKEVPEESGLFEEGFVLVEFQCEGVEEVEIGPNKYFLVSLDEKTPPTLGTLAATNVSAMTVKGSPASASIQSNGSTVVGGDIFLVSNFSDPVQFEILFRPISNSKLSVRVYDLKGAGEPFEHAFDKPVKMVIQTRRAGAGLGTQIRVQDLNE